MVMSISREVSPLPTKSCLCFLSYMLSSALITSHFYEKHIGSKKIMQWFGTPNESFSSKKWWTIQLCNISSVHSHLFQQCLVSSYLSRSWPPQSFILAHSSTLHVLPTFPNGTFRSLIHTLPPFPPSLHLPIMLYFSAHKLSFFEFFFSFICALEKLCYRLELCLPHSLFPSPISGK
jgi:hypothetical protein